MGSGSSRVKSERYVNARRLAAGRSSATGHKNSRRMTRVNSPRKKINSEIDSRCQARIFATDVLFLRTGVSFTKRYPSGRMGGYSPTPLSHSDKHDQRDESSG